MRIDQLVFGGAPFAQNDQCENLDEALLCSSDCKTNLGKCFLGNRESVTCTDRCPCNTDCFEGCPCDYDSFYCPSECKSANSDQFNACVHRAQNVFYKCSDLCESFDIECEQDCTKVYIDELSKCPCLKDCPGKVVKVR